MSLLRAAVAVWALLTALFAAAPSARADTWLPAEVIAYVSANGNWRFTVTPRQLRSPLAYFEDKVAGQEPAGQSGSGVPQARGLLEHRTAEGWSPVWAQPLVNDVAPVSALVSNDGSHVATFDNWHSMGFGENVVVIYGPEGVVVRALALSDFLPEDYIGALPRSVSSLHWRGEPRIDARRLRIPVVIPDPKDEAGLSPSTIDIGVDLTTGAAAPIDPAAWTRAEKAAAVAIAEQQRQEQERRRYMTDPLLPPTAGEERKWHQYLIEAGLRLGHGVVATVVLRDPRARDYRASVGFLEARLDPREYRSPLVFIGSPDLANLVIQIEKSAARAPAGALSDTAFSIVASAEDWPRIVAALGPSGARLERIDPATPIPQLPERLPR